MKTKKTILLATAAACCALTLSACSETGPLAINAQNFPDESVRAYVSQTYDLDGNGWLTSSEIAAMRAAEDYTGTAADLPSMDVLAARLYEKQQPGIDIDAAHFPDEAFRNYVSQYCDTNGSGRLSQSELDAVTYIGCGAQKIVSLKGVEYFTSLTFLDCRTNQLTELDLSHNTKLEHLECSSNALTALDVSANPALTYLSCGKNDLTSLDVTHNANLTDLYCSECGITALDVTQNTKLTDLDCSYNQLTELDLSQNTLLEQLGCSGNHLTVLDLSHNSRITLYYYETKTVKLIAPVRNYMTAQ